MQSEIALTAACCVELKAGLLPAKHTLALNIAKPSTRAKNKSTGNPNMTRYLPT
jgi:hypothetical protein